MDASGEFHEEYGTAAIRHWPDQPGGCAARQRLVHLSQDSADPGVLAVADISEQESCGAGAGRRLSSAQLGGRIRRVPEASPRWLCHSLPGIPTSVHAYVCRCESARAARQRKVQLLLVLPRRRPSATEQEPCDEYRSSAGARTRRSANADRTVPRLRPKRRTGERLRDPGGSVL